MACDYIAPAHDKDVWDFDGKIKKPHRVIITPKTDKIDCWKGQGYYRIAYSDGGQDFTCDGPVWYDSYMQLSMALEDAWATATPTHLPYSEYIGVMLPAEGE